MQSDRLLLSVGAKCVLTGAPEHLLQKIRKQLTLPNPKYQAAKQYGRWVGKKMARHLYFYEEHGHEIVVPRGFAASIVQMCCETVGRQPDIHDQRRTLSGMTCSFSGELREYQNRALDDILQRDFGVLVAGTGSGKTVVGLKAITVRAQPTLVLVHTKELLYQWVEQVNVFTGMEAGLIGDGKFIIRPITVGIVNTVKKHLDSLPSQFGHLVVDECHRVPASLFTDVVTAFDAKYALGLSATAYRREELLTKLIFMFVGPCVHRIESGSLMESGAILKPEIHLKYTEFTFSYRNNYAALMKALTADDQRNKQIADDVVSRVKAAQGIIIVVSDRVAHCERLAQLISEKGTPASVLTGRTAGHERTQIVEAINNDAIKVLVSTVQLIGEGFDAKQLSSLFLATPIKFSGRLKQVIGRILRPQQGKKACVYDYVDHRVGVLRNSAKKRSETYSSYT